MSRTWKASRPQEDPGKTQSVFPGRGGAAEWTSFRPWPEARDMELVPTRRMPSDAVARLWLEELEGLE